MTGPWRLAATSLRGVTPHKRRGIGGTKVPAARAIHPADCGQAKNKTQARSENCSKLPDLEQSKSAVLNSLTSPSSQRSYDHAIREFIEWYCSAPRLAFNQTVVTRYRISLEQSHYASPTINLRLAAVRRLAYEAADSGLLSPDLAAGIRRVKGSTRLGVRAGNWLTAEQGKRLLDAFDQGTLRGKRDYAMVAVLLGCGLRRAELAGLTVDELQQREDHRVIADLMGKGGHMRTVPSHPWSKRRWTPGEMRRVLCPGRCFGRSTRPGKLGIVSSVRR